MRELVGDETGPLRGVGKECPTTKEVIQSSDSKFRAQIQNHSPESLTLDPEPSPFTLPLIHLPVRRQRLNKPRRRLPHLPRPMEATKSIRNERETKRAEK